MILKGYWLLSTISLAKLLKGVYGVNMGFYEDTKITDFHSCHSLDKYNIVKSVRLLQKESN